MLHQKFPYQPLAKIKTAAGRMYQTPEGQSLPSVTTILGKTADKTFLKEWRKRVGNEAADKITKTSTDLGTVMHKMLEDYIAEDKEPAGNFFAKAMATCIIKHGLKNVDQVWGLEIGLYANGLYGGTTDCVGIHAGAPAIIDFKNSRRLKKEEWVGDYQLQTVAYALCHNEMFGTNIEKGVIMLSTHDAEYQEFVIEGDQFWQKADEWAERVTKYFEIAANR